MTLDHNYQIIDIKHQGDQLRRTPDLINLHQQSISLFNRSRFHGKVWRLWQRILNHPIHVLSLSELKMNLKLGNSYEKGLDCVAIDQIIGSVSRCEDFDAHFAPIKEGSNQRWARIARLFFLGEAIEAVELIQVADRYFVLDGHHRISVAKALGKKFIDSHVTVLQFQEKISWQSILGPERKRVLA